MHSVLPVLTPSQKRVLALVVLAGGAAGARQIQKEVRRAQREQNALCAEVDQSSRNGAGKGKKKTVAVDAVFFQRIGTILGICVPEAMSKEAALILFQGVLLVSRTFLTDHISKIEARAGRHLISQNFSRFAAGSHSVGDGSQRWSAGGL